MGCLCSKPSRSVEGQGNRADNARVSTPNSSLRWNTQQTSASTGYSLHNIVPDQPSKDHSIPTETSTTTLDTSGLLVPDRILNTPPHPRDPTPGFTVSETQPFDTRTNASASSSVPPNQPRVGRFAPVGSSLTASGAFTTPTANQTPAPVLTTYIPYTMTGPTIPETQPSEAQNKENSSALWEEAFRKMPASENGRTGGQPFPNGSLVENIIQDLKGRKEKCDDKRWFFIMDDRKVFMIDNLLLQLNKYALIGDIALQHNPDIVALVWAGFRGLLLVGTAYVNLMRLVSEGLDYLVKLLCCCHIYEKIYCNTAFDISKDLNECLVILYVSILKYLRKASSYLNQNTWGRILGSFSGEMEGLLCEIKSNETELNRKIDIADKEASASNRFNQDTNLNKLRGLLVGIQEPIKETLRVVEIIYAKVANERRFKILTWLSEVEYESHHLLSVKRRLHGTGSWLLQNGEFKDWRDSESNPILWLRADAGFGKTILASSVVDSFEHLSASDDHVLAYFYCNYKEPTRRSTDSILRTLVKQFCVKGVKENKVPTLVDDIYKKREEKGNARGQLSSEESTELIIGLSEKYLSTTILVDALDECDIQTRRALFSSLHRISQEATRVKIVVTSRYDADIYQFFSCVPNYYIEAKDNSADINLYIAVELKRRCDPTNVFCEDALLLGGEIDQCLTDLVEETLKSKANGMFMWVNLQIDALCAAQTPEDVRSALSTMPETLNETYLQVLERIRAQDRNAYRVAKEILKWLLYAQEACTTGSVIQALAIEVQPGKQTLNQNGLSWTISKILGVCKNLVIHDEDLDIFRFAHFSVQEFLFSQADFEQRRCNTYIAEVCLTTLLNHYKSDTPVQALYQYAARNWAAHVSLSEATSGHVEDLCIGFLASYTPYRVWGDTITRVNHQLRTQEGGVVAQLWVACYYELYHLVEGLLRVSNTELNCRNSNQDTSLSWAARKGNEKVVKLLLEKDGVDVNSKDTYDHTPLCLAAWKGNEKVVQLLLDKEGVEVNLTEQAGRSPLSLAAESGHEEVAQRLLDKEGVEVNLRDQDGRTPLSLAAGNGLEKVVQLLLEKEGVDVDSKDMYGWTPLSLAAQRGREKVVQLLLGKEGVDVDSKDINGQTPLSLAAENGHEKVVQLLLGKEGVDVDSKDNYDHTPLFLAAWKGREKVVQLLLDKEGVEVNPKDQNGRTPLSLAAGNGLEKVMQLLLEKEGVDVDSKDINGQTPLSLAAENGHEKVVQLLLGKEGVDVDSKDNYDHTPLFLAAWKGREKVVQLLLDKEGVEVNPKDQNGRTPLSLAAGNGLEKVVQLLLEKEGVDVGSKDMYGRTPVSLAAQRGREKVLQLLLGKEGVEVEFKDYYGQTPLSLAAENGHEKVVQLLLGKEGVDVHSKDMYSRTPLSLAAQRGREKVLQLLLDKEGVEVNAKDQDGRTPLSRAAENGCNVINMLLERGRVAGDPTDNQVRTPLEIVRENDQQPVAAPLEKELSELATVSDSISSLPVEPIAAHQ